MASVVSRCAVTHFKKWLLRAATAPRFAWRAPRRAAASRQQGLATLGKARALQHAAGRHSTVTCVTARCSKGPSIKDVRTRGGRGGVSQKRTHADAGGGHWQNADVLKIQIFTKIFEVYLVYCVPKVNSRLNN